MHVGESDPTSGLKFRLNATRLMNHFGLSEDQIRKSLPESHQTMPDSEWRGAGTDNTEDWKGFKGHFRDIEEIERFMAMLCP